MFSPSNKIHREVGRAKDLSALRIYLCVPVTRSFERVNEHLDSTKHGGLLEWVIIWLLKKSCGLHGAGY